MSGYLQRLVVGRRQESTAVNCQGAESREPAAAVRDPLCSSAGYCWPPATTATGQHIHGERRAVAHGEGHDRTGARDLTRGARGTAARGEGSREGESDWRREVSFWMARSEVCFCVRGVSF